MRDADGRTVPASGYTATYANNVSVGTATVTVTGRGQYTGTVRAAFPIVAGKAGWVTVDGVRRWSTGSGWGSGWLTVGGQTYWPRGAGNPYGPAGSVATGWLDEGGQTYFLRRANSPYGPRGSIGSGWLTEGGRRYFLRRAGSPYGPRGSLGYGWLTDGGRRYYLSRPGGAALTGSHVIGGRLYRFNGSGALV